MRALIQRVSRGAVTIDRKETRVIGNGLVVLLGIEESDNDEDISWLSKKLVQLRIFDDTEGIMNLSIQDIQGDILLISQFTLHAKTKKGNRPSYIMAAKPDIAIPLYEKFIRQISSDMGKQIITGEFGAYMQVELVNDGPVTIFIDTQNKE